MWDVEHTRLSVFGGVGRVARVVVTLVTLPGVGELHGGDVGLPANYISFLFANRPNQFLLLTS